MKPTPQKPRIIIAQVSRAFAGTYHSSNRFPLEYGVGFMRHMMLFILLGSILAATPASSQQTGRAQDGFYSGQSNGQVSGPSNGQATGRVDGRANKTEGVPPTVGDASKKTAPSDGAGGYPNDAESMDAIARPGFQR